MPDTNYSFCGGVSELGGTAGNISNRFVFPDQANKVTTSYRVRTANQTMSVTEDGAVMCMFFR
jgi:hypothetical protein